MSGTRDGGGAGRWLQLALGIVCLSLVANLQYGWTFFVDPIRDRHGWDRASIQVAFTVFVVAQTWLVPVEGWLADRYGPRSVTLVGGLLCAAAWVMNAHATSLMVLYVAAAVGGAGAGAVYATCIGNALRWFPDRRGLAAGLTAMGFGAGSALTVVPIRAMIRDGGYESAFLQFGIGQGLAVMLVALFLVSPKRGDVPDAARPGTAKRDYAPAETVRTPVFWVLYAMVAMLAAGGLTVTAQLGPIAGDFAVADVPVDLLGVALPALTFAATLDRALNGAARPLLGWVSDRVGRETTMVLAFGFEGLAICALGLFGSDPLAFVLLAGLVFFAWGEIDSLFPATCADTFGARHAAANAGLLYTAKGTAALVVPYTSIVTAWTGNWHAVFLGVGALSIVAALMALFILKPMRKAYLNRAGTPAPAR